MGKELKKNRYMYKYTLLCIWKYHNIVNQLYSNIKQFKKYKIKFCILLKKKEKSNPELRKELCKNDIEAK